MKTKRTKPLRAIRDLSSIGRLSLGLIVAGGVLTPLATLAAKAQKLGDLRGVGHAEFNHDGSRIVLHHSGNVGIWDVAAGTRVTGDLGANAASVRYIMSSDAKMILVQFKEGQWRVFDAATAKAISPMFDAPVREDSMHKSVLFSPDVSTVLVFDMKEATVFDVRSGKRLATIPLPIGPDDLEPGSAQFTAGGARCLVMDGNGTVTTYGTKDWKPIGKPMKHPPADDAYDFHLSVSDDGKWLATSDTPGEHNFEGQLQLWDAVANTPLGEPIVAMNGLTSRFLRGDRVVILPERGDVNVRELPSTNVAYSLDSGDHTSGPTLDVSKDQKWIVAWDEDWKINLVDATNGKVADFCRGPAKIEQVMIAPDSSSCYVVFDNSAFDQEKHYDNYVVRFKLPEMEITHTFRSMDSDPDVSLSPDGKRLLVVQGASDQERVLFLDTATLKPLN